MSNSDRLTPQEIRQILGWADDRPLEIYDNTTADERNSQIHQTLGFSDGDDADGDDLALGKAVCHNCRSDLSDDAEFCSQCGAPVTDAAKAFTEETHSDLEAERKTVDTPESRCSRKSG